MVFDDSANCTYLRLYIYVCVYVEHIYIYVTYTYKYIYMHIHTHICNGDFMCKLDYLTDER